MKKVININFQGRVTPIEESAYDLLKQYVESLRKFFAKEEGAEEIVNDIESRIAELFSESLKKGSTCITEDDVNKIIASMGRPEDFEEEEVHAKQASETTHSQPNAGSQTAPAGKLYRDHSDKILGGVCGGLGNYLKIDPTIVRLIFALIIFAGGTGILLYVLLWVILPSKSLENITSTKRLYRNSEQKVVAGVASGIALYFNIAIWIPRLIFAFPLVIGIFTSIFRSGFGFHPFPTVVFGSFGGTLFIVYAVLWAVIPEAKSASEKLEMRGEKIDLNTIKNTIQEDLEGFKARAEKWGGEFKNQTEKWSAEFSQTMGQKGRQFGNEAGSVAKSGGSRLINVLGTLFKAFFLFIAGIISFAFLMTFIGLSVAGISIYPLKDFILEGFTQNILALLTFLLFLGIPVVAMVTWVVRRIMGVRSGNKYLSFTFAGLWTIGLICAVFLTASISHDFAARAREKVDFTMAQPSNGKLLIKVPETKVKLVSRWVNFDNVLNMTEDSLYLNNVNVRILKSIDSNFHVETLKYSNGYDERTATHNVSQIGYQLHQEDSILNLDRGFALKRGSRFRNQSVSVNIHVPVGKKIKIKGSINKRFEIFNDHDNNWDFDEDWANGYSWRADVEYLMTSAGLERIYQNGEEKDTEASDVIDNFKKSKKELRKELEKREQELEQKQRETELLKKELEKAMDSSKLVIKKAVSKLNEQSRKSKMYSKKSSFEPVDELKTSAEASWLVLMQMAS